MYLNIEFVIEYAPAHSNESHQGRVSRIPSTHPCTSVLIGAYPEYRQHIPAHQF